MKKPATKKPAAKKLATKKPAATPSKVGPRGDFGRPIDGFFKKQAPPLRSILETLRGLVEDVVPEAESSIKWGMPFFTLGGTMMCALGGFKAHVNLVLAGPPSIYADPEGRLGGDAKGGRHLKLRAGDQVPVKQVRAWLRAAADHARRER